MLSSRRQGPDRDVGRKASKNEPIPPRSVAVVGGRLISLASGTSTDERIGLIAGRQRGRVARWQLLAAGVDRHAIDRRVRNGRLPSVHSGVYALPHTGDTPLAVETAALLACGPGAVLSHHSAVTLWGLRPGVARPVHVTIPGNRHGATPTGVVIHRSRKLAPADVRLHHGLPVTSPARALLDAAATLPDQDMERLFDEALFARRLVTRAQISMVMKRAGNHPGRGRLARVMAAYTQAAQTDDSPAAETLDRLMREAGLPEPQREVPMLDYRLDFYWPELRLAVEVDAYGTHGSPARFEADRRRDARLLAERDVVVIRVTKRMIERRPLEVIALISRAIGRRETTLESARSRSR